jgi:hypothetical protein
MPEKADGEDMGKIRDTLRKMMGKIEEKHSERRTRNTRKDR